MVSVSNAKYGAAFNLSTQLWKSFSVDKMVYKLLSTSVSGASTSSTSSVDNSFPQVLNSYSVKYLSKAALSAGFTLIASKSSSNSTSHLMVASSYDNGRRSRASRRFSPTLPFTNSAFSITPFNVPYASSHLTAVFGPHLSTPGMLSTLSPIRAK